MTVGGPGRLLPAGGGEDGRFPEGAPGVQQEQLQQIPCGFRLQGFQPPALGVFAHQRIPLGTDYRDREDEHPPALPPPAVGQKECGQEAGAGAGRAGGRELRSAPENRPDRQPRHDRGHLKIREIREFPRLFPLFSPLTPPPSPPPFLPLPPPPFPKRSDFPGSALFIWDSPLSRFFFFFFCIYAEGIWMEKENLGSLGEKKKKSHSQNSAFFSGIAGICSLESLWDNSGLFLKFLLFFGFFFGISRNSLFPAFCFSWDCWDLLLKISQNSFVFPSISQLFLGGGGDCWDLLPSQNSSCTPWDIPEFLIPKIPFFSGIIWIYSLKSPRRAPYSQNSPFPGIPDFFSLRYPGIPHSQKFPFSWDTSDLLL